MKNTTKIFSVLAVTLALTIGVNTVYAQENTDSKTDLSLMMEAQLIDKDVEMKVIEFLLGIESIEDPQERFDEILDVLNSRNIYYIPTQAYENSLEQYEVMEEQKFLDKPIQTTATTSSHVFFVSTDSSDDIKYVSTTCSSCKVSDKKLSIKSGMSWPHPLSTLWEFREESRWSQWTNTHATVTSQIHGDEKDVKPYVVMKSKKPITTASFDFGSEIQVRMTSGKFIALEPMEEKSYNGVYFPTKLNTLKASFNVQDDLPKETKHEVSIQIVSIT